MQDLSFPPLATPSIVGFAQASAFVSEVAEDLARRVVSGQSIANEVNPVLARAVELANSLHFRFHVRDLVPDHPLVLDNLDSETPVSIEGLDDRSPTRKLTVVLALRSGATIAFPSIAKERRLVAGTIAMFPAFLHNEVVAEPDFLALVSHAIGPSFV